MKQHIWKWYLMPWCIFKPLFLHALACFESLLDKGGTRTLLVVLVSLVIFWHIYTPIHELLHVGACLAGGGTVTELALKPQYGGHLLARIFPFVVAESEYAGQLTGFTTPNYWVYALVDLAPYVLSLPGILLLELSRRRNWAPLFSVGMVLAFVPLMSVTGDYYELVSLVFTQLAEAMRPDWPAGVLIADDWFKLMGDLREAGRLDAVSGSLAVFGLLAGIWAAMVTLACQWHLAVRVFGAGFDTPTASRVDTAV
ncbi:hypothetical protein SCOR_24665 [Sulfidibacter corallicola]|uniref:Uncharacterized protein n=1 Tax=Sulfidibacter corallicola TaxID=2818388 RepID=A0A8A4TQZ8_SULCO|nr:hypothetical protein [Sulfidibacter corallicola]QTD52399.1 hypothetical protein J3U87_07990 [Sulfidibacter corallicola]